MKCKWWEEKTEDLHRAADANDIKTFYNGLREIYGPQKRGTERLIAQDGVIILKEKGDTLNRFAQHFNHLLNVSGVVDQTALNQLPDITADRSLDETPNFDKVTVAIASTKENKAPGGCGITAEIWKYGGRKLQQKIHELIKHT